MMDKFIAQFNALVEKIEDLFASLYQQLLALFDFDNITDKPSPLD